jgi:hypothetical protein
VGDIKHLTKKIRNTDKLKGQLGFYWGRNAHQLGCRESFPRIVKLVQEHLRVEGRMLISWAGNIFSN